MLGTFFILYNQQDLIMLMPNLIYMNTITLESSQLTYHVIYQKNRKTIQLKVLTSTHLEITAPNNFPNASIQKILHKKRNWIVKQILHLSNAMSNPINKSITHGARVLYLGAPHTLIFTSNYCSQPTIHLKDNQIIIDTPNINTAQTTPLAESLLRQWYLESASNILSAKTSLWAAKINVQPQRITIKEQKTRWGSCSSKGNLNYNWRIVMAPPEVIDYLVIHELCHLRVPNHSALFWQVVGKFSPNFKNHRTWLQTNGTILMGILKLK
ncbi:MAG: hypothetical protein H6Q68_2091 [Firmicutes bacterium]|nr:hypothetical protein [Bacillota bacterium]